MFHKFKILKMNKLAKIIFNFSILAFCSLLIVHHSSLLYAQTRPKIYFLSDSIEVGRPFRLGMSFRHLSQHEVFFADTAHDFQPFRVLSQENFTTETINKTSIDSSVYTLVSFELSPKQSLRLPVWVIAGKDCTAIFSLPDSVILKRVLRENNNQLQTDLEVTPLPNRFNYPFWFLILMTAIFICLILLLFFRKTTLKYIALAKLFLKNQEFERAFRRINGRFKESRKIEPLETALVLWKKHLQYLDNKPFTTYTTREIADSLPHEQVLVDALRTIDEAIYGGVVSVNTDVSMVVLRNLARQHYQQRRIEILD
jgi:hypothetical protein